MQSITASIKFIRELDFNKFHIPSYQRPYRWQPSHVDKLLSCIRDNMDKDEYRIGSIILNPSDNGKHLDIVDGQQRLTTLSLIFICLDAVTNYRLQSSFKHIESKESIYRNYHHIKRWIDRQNIDHDELKRFILNKCSVVEIIVDDLSEAFQMFDSQNGRGKELEAYNLLKAYHLRAIDNEIGQIKITEDKKHIDRKWEEAALMRRCDNDMSLLKYLINELFRVRQWSRHKSGQQFSKSKIGEFKGIQFTNSQSPLPLHNHSFLLYLYFNEHLKTASRSEANRHEENPFVSINMDIINGTVFFSYIQTYVSAYNYLFQSNINENHPLFSFRKDFENYCLRYAGAHRTGDTYIREVYIALIMVLYDRFGEKAIARWYKILYNLAYRKRMEQQTVFYSSVATYPMTYFEIIASAIDESGLESLTNHANHKIECNRLGTKEQDIAAFILANGGQIKIMKDGLSFRNHKYRYEDTLTKENLSNGTK